MTGYALRIVTDAGKLATKEFRRLKKFQFTQKNFDEICKVLGAKYVDRADKHRFVIENEKEKRKLSLEIFADIPIGDDTGNLISVYTMNSHIQLHFCTGFVISDSLGEVVFISEYQGRLSGLIVERGAGCSIYANLDNKILSGDFTTLAPEVMMSGIALSVAEHLIPDGE
ncbi:MAG: hypothetical protein R3C26_02790 [Calditrichia bacterium]